jgi:alanine-glyoxylate transaminase/serine-glyoxylate transaminase/serine-pyruvate transaminase
VSGRHALFIPGTTHVPDRILRALSRPMEDHPGSEFPLFSQSLLCDLKRVFKTGSAPPHCAEAWQLSFSR